MKIILSRKGFDIQNGGRASPILPDGSLFSLPIPIRGEPITYAQIQFQDRSAAQILGDLRPAGYRFDGQAASSPWAEVPAHLDPDLRASATARAAEWQPLFGQDGAAQSHLHTNGVGSGDLFLFFGRFRQTVWKRDRLAYAPNAPDLHLIFGWLEVGRVWPVPQCPPRHLPSWALYHPHAITNYGHTNNTIYAAGRGGAFRSFDPVLQLTTPDTRQCREWRLPAWFYPFSLGRPRPPLTFHANPGLWTPDGDHVRLCSAAPGQEFVLDADYYPEADQWVRDILTVPVAQ